MSLLVAGRSPRAADQPAKPLGATLAHRDQAAPTPAPWGEWRRLLRGNTHGLADLVVSTFTLKPGQEPHPPHQHADEELMILAAGHGTWHLDGKDSPTREGDVVYAAPWTMHGLRNTSNAPLTYHVLKWNGKAVPPAERPPPR
jgi:quercetin dioxygenase-like cupin family protein